jgi:hypothetical protein
MLPTMLTMKNFNNTSGFMASDSIADQIDMSQFLDEEYTSPSAEYFCYLNSDSNDTKCRVLLISSEEDSSLTFEILARSSEVDNLVLGSQYKKISIKNGENELISWTDPLIKRFNIELTENNFHKVSLTISKC